MPYEKTLTGQGWVVGEITPTQPPYAYSGGYTKTLGAQGWVVDPIPPKSGGGSVPGATGTLSAAATSQTAVQLTFTDASGATGHQYRIDGGTPQTLAGDKIVTGLTASTAYGFEVRGTNASGQGAWSNVASATTQSAGVSPASFVAAGTPSESSASPYTPAMPAGWQVGDFLLLLTSSSNTDNVGTQDGILGGGSGSVWLATPKSAQFQGSANSAGSTRLQTYWTRAVTGQTGPQLNNNGDHQAAQIIAFRGVHATCPFAVSAAGASSGAPGTALTLPGITTDTDQTMVVHMVAHAVDTATPQVSGWTNAGLTNLSELAEVASLLNLGGGLAVAAGIKTTAGATGSTAATLATSANASWITIGLRPTAAPALNGAAIAANTQFAEGVEVTLLRPQVVRYGSTLPSTSNFWSATFPPGTYTVGNPLFDAGDPWPFNAKVVTIDPT